MSSNIHLTVDTVPMAESVHGVAHHVDATTAAIVSMEAATVAAEHAAAEHICTNVNRGFHTLLISQISQKCAKARSVVDAKLQELLHLQTSLKRIREQMEHDFHRISDRYLKIFRNLDNALRTRIFELDKPAADLTIRQMPEANHRMLSCGVQTPVHQSESVNATQSIVSSAMRSHALKALSHMHGMLERTATLQSAMATIIDQSSVQSSTLVMIPAVLVEYDDPNLSMSTQKVYLPQDFSRIASDVKSTIQSLPWTESGEMAEAVRTQAKIKLGQASVSDRVRSKALELSASMTWHQTKAGEL